MKERFTKGYEHFLIVPSKEDHQKYDIIGPYTKEIAIELKRETGGFIMNVPTPKNENKRPSKI